MHFHIECNAQPRGKKRLISNFQGELKRPRALTGTKTFVDTTRLSVHPKGTFLGHIEIRKPRGDFIVRCDNLHNRGEGRDLLVMNPPKTDGY